MQQTKFPRVIFPDRASALSASAFFIKEKGVGYWLYTENEQILCKGEVIWSNRYALHLPSIDRHSQALSDGVITDFMKEAEHIGLIHCNEATGYWTLSNTDELQEEHIWILYTEQILPEDSLRELALRVLETCNQDAVAMEINGKVEVLRR